MERQTPETLAARLAETSRELAALDTERNSLALAVEEGDEVATRRLSDLDQARPEMVEALARLRSAQEQAQERQNVEVRAEAAQREAERIAKVKRMVNEQAERIASFDSLVEQIRSSLIGIKAGNAALFNVIGGRSSESMNDFNVRVPVIIQTALAVGGYDFKAMPFVFRDADGLPAIEACRLSPHFQAGWLLQLAGAAGQDKAA